MVRMQEEYALCVCTKFETDSYSFKSYKGSQNFEIGRFMVHTQEGSVLCLYQIWNG